ncbi:hypothetical protein BBI10_02270 [Pseudomonas graminis]|uniref:Uncharacterized protein n=2 Tax=Pseudomonas graminis TaxID=158627 RepID=A0A1C2EF99_9PSED|nr:hypothetical protein BBI10_02270 [Pseudomonas graminis]
MGNHNSDNPEALHIRNYTDINSEVFKRYESFLRDNNRPVANAEKLKTAMTVVAKEDDRIPLITLPIIYINKSNGNPPLTPEGFDSLELALTSHVNGIWAKLKFRKEVETATPYTAAEVMDKVRPCPTKARIFQWINSMNGKSRSIDRLTCDKLFRNCPDREIRFLADDKAGPRKIKAIFERDKHLFATGQPKINPFKTGGFANWQVDYARLVKTLLTHGFPFKHDLQMQFERYSQRKVAVIEEGCDDIVKILIHRLTTANRGVSERRLLMVDEVLALYFPTIVDMTALTIFMMFQSGWNKETALSIDQDNFEHVLAGTIEEAIKVVFSEKNRSQGIGKPFDDPKRINMPTRADDPYSLYNLIRLARKVSEPLADYPFDVIPALCSEDRMNPMFMCLRPWGEWLKGGRHTSIAHPKTFQVGVQQFLRQYNVSEEGQRLTVAAELTRRLRPTWLLYKKKHNPIALLSMTMGHSDRDTTDIFYDNSGAAHQERMKRLRSELEEIISLLRMRQFKGLLGKQAQAEASANLKIFHIPGQQKAMWGCANQKKPDWVGSEIIARTGKKCFAIKECIFCSQMRVFEDSLPYLMERESHLDELLDGEDDTGFRSRIAKEREALQFILDIWGDEDEITSAARYRRRSRTPLLPRDLSILEIVFESEDYNV